jgi:acyl dehydratase
MKQLFFEEVEVGTEVPSLARKVSLLNLIKYAAASWEFFLVHIDKEFARKQGFKDVIIPAAYFGASLAKMISDWMGNRGRLKKLSYKVTVMCFVGDTLICKGKVIKKYREAGHNLVDCDIWVENQDGVKMVPASATVSLPAGQA